MRVAALYDIHGNLPALEAVLAEIRALDVDELIIGGDVFPGPFAPEVLDRLMALELPVRYLKGNGDRAVVEAAAGQPLHALPEAARPAVEWGARAATPDQLRRMAAWPATLRLAAACRRPEQSGHPLPIIEGCPPSDHWERRKQKVAVPLELPKVGEVLFCHATPYNDVDVFTRRSSDERVRALLGGETAPLVVCGHTHMQFDRRVGNTRILNAGSVGMPFGDPGADWLLLSPQPELRHTAYDLEAAAARVRSCPYPGAAEFADREILHPRPAAEMEALFEGRPGT
ncbi:MAG TPA: metallophosphoesterase family protein [Terriglobales bacterium]|nr:metallophosphoesterase family protein [Terriglobales bacterium]